MAVTNTFSFTLLNGSDPAGHNSINTLVNSIDTRLQAISSGLATASTSPGTLSTGQVLRWSGTSYASAFVDATSLASNAVTTDKINALAVTTDKINDSAVTSAKIANDTIVNADINSSAGIVDTKLATISTAGKVANSATTAASANGNNTIVARDSAGNFAADTITASSFVGTATRASNLGGGSDGSIPYQSAANTTAMLANGTAGQVLTSNGTTLAPSWQAASIGEANIATNAVTESKIAAGAVTYAKLNADAKTYDVPTSGTGVYFTASGDFTSASLSTASAQNPVVISAASSAIDLSLPNTVGTEGATITVCQTGTGAVTIKPKVGATATINGSTSVTYTLGAQYSVVTLICLSNSGSNGTWVITGDYY